jgi:hypothetical protein
MEFNSKYKEELAIWLRENPEPTHYTWDSPEFLTWLHTTNAPTPLPKSAIGNRAFFAKPHMAEFVNYLTNNSSGVWNSNTTKFYAIDPAGLFSSPKIGNRFIQIGIDKLEMLDECNLDTYYYLDSETGNILKLDGYVFQNYLDTQDFGEMGYDSPEYNFMLNDILTEILRQNNVCSKSFQKFVLQHILNTQKTIWSKSKPKDPFLFATNYNVLRIMAGLGGLGYIT